MRFRSSSIRIAAVCLAPAFVAVRLYADPTTADDIAADPGRPLFTPWTASELANPEHAWSVRFSTIFLQCDPAGGHFVSRTRTPASRSSIRTISSSRRRPVPTSAWFDRAKPTIWTFATLGSIRETPCRAPSTLGRGTGFAGAGGGSPDSVAITSSDVSSLHSAEANLRRDLTASCSLLAGFRYVSFRDRMSALGVDTVTPTSRTFASTGITTSTGCKSASKR